TSFSVSYIIVVLFFFYLLRTPPSSTLFPYTTLFRSQIAMTHILLPYMILPIANALRQIDPSLARAAAGLGASPWATFRQVTLPRSEEHTSELQSLRHLVCRLLLEKKKFEDSTRNLDL